LPVIAELLFTSSGVANHVYDYITLRAERPLRLSASIKLAFNFTFRAESKLEMINSSCNPHRLKLSLNSVDKSKALNVKLSESLLSFYLLLNIVANDV
jgi:hypothetical protein